MGGIRAVSIAASSTRATLSVIGKTRIAQESDRSSVLTRYRWSSALQFAVTGMIERGHAGSTLAGLGKDRQVGVGRVARSEEHTSELQSRENLVCRLLLEKKK